MEADSNIGISKGGEMRIEDFQMPEGLEGEALENARDLVNQLLATGKTLNVDRDAESNEKVDVTVDYVDNVEYNLWDDRLDVEVFLSRTPGGIAHSEKEAIFTAMENNGFARPEGNPNYGVLNDWEEYRVSITNYMEVDE